MIMSAHVLLNLLSGKRNKMRGVSISSVHFFIYILPFFLRYCAPAILCNVCQ